MFKPSTFVEECKAAGFTPARAMMLYDELRTFCGPEVAPRTPPDRSLWDQTRAFAAQGLEHCDTPQKFQAYLESWGEAFDPRLLMEASPAEMGHLFSRVPRADAINRFSGMMAYDLPERWQAWEELGLGWDDVTAALAQDRPALTAPQDAPPALTDRQAAERLERAVAASGLSSFSWPWALGDEPATRWALAADLSRCTQELAGQTGWEPSILGLKGRVSLDWGADRSGCSGHCATMGNDHRITTSPQTGWGPVAHEWLHALDATLEQSSPSAPQAAATKAWAALHKGLDRAAWKEEDRPLVQAAMGEALKNQWKAFPQTQEKMRALFGKPLPSNAMAQLQDTITADLASRGDPGDLVPMRAVNALTDLSMAQEALEEPSSLWTTFGHRFKENALRHLSASDANDWASYFLEPAERVAHSFEAMFPQHALVSDVKPNHGFRYPLAPEAAQHDLAWKRFFRAATGWKNALSETGLAPAAPEAEAPLSLAARLRARRETGMPAAPAPSLGR